MALPNLAGLRTGPPEAPTEKRWDELPSELRGHVLSFLEQPHATSGEAFSNRSMWTARVRAVDPGRENKWLATMAVYVDNKPREYLSLEPVTVRILAECTPGFSAMGDSLRAKALEWRAAGALPKWRIKRHFDNDPTFADDDGAHDNFKFDTNAENGLPAEFDHVEIEFDLRGVWGVERSLCDEAIDILFECCPKIFSLMVDKLVERYDAVFAWEQANNSGDARRIGKARQVHTLIHLLRNRWNARKGGKRPEPTSRTSGKFPSAASPP